jgi:hypothetical protein
MRKFLVLIGCDLVMLSLREERNDIVICSKETYAQFHPEPPNFIEALPRYIDNDYLYSYREPILYPPPENDHHSLTTKRRTTKIKGVRGWK